MAVFTADRRSAATAAHVNYPYRRGRCGIEEGIQVIVGEGVAAPFVQLSLAPVVTTKYQELGRCRDPGSVRKQDIDLTPHGVLLQGNDVALL